MTKSNTTPFVPTAAGRALDRALKLTALDESFALDLDRAFDEARLEGLLLQVLLQQAQTTTAAPTSLPLEAEIQAAPPQKPKNRREP